jgi:hypothetical protein
MAEAGYNRAAGRRFMRCPDLPEPYARALRAAVEYAVARFDPLGVVAAGARRLIEAGPEVTEEALTARRYAPRRPTRTPSTARPAIPPRQRCCSRAPSG